MRVSVSTGPGLRLASYLKAWNVKMVNVSRTWGIF
jgi:hypothetical protein